MAIINPEDVEGAPGGYGAGDERIAALEAELTQAHADNAKLETLWENAVAARDKLSEDLTRARAERDAAREALEKFCNQVIRATSKWTNVGKKECAKEGVTPDTMTLIDFPAKDFSALAELNEAARAAIKAEGE